MKSVTVDTTEIVYSATYKCELLGTHVIATGSKTIIDLTDGKSLSVYIGANQPHTQIYDSNTLSFSPDWSTTDGMLALTPIIYVNQAVVSLSDPSLTVLWKRKVGNTENALTTGEVVSGNVLTVSQNKLGNVPTGLLTYVMYVSYKDSNMTAPATAKDELSFALVRTEKTKGVSIVGEQVFKYESGSLIPTPSIITLGAILQKCDKPQMAI